MAHSSLDEYSKFVEPVRASSSYSLLPEHQDHSGSPDDQVQRVRVRDHDQLRRVSGGDPVTQRLHSR